jgi:hypothetical protein
LSGRATAKVGTRFSASSRRRAWSLETRPQLRRDRRRFSYRFLRACTPFGRTSTT